MDLKPFGEWIDWCQFHEFLARSTGRMNDA